MYPFRSLSNAIAFPNLSIDVEMTIEPPSSVGMAEIKGTPSPKKRIRAVLSVEGYILPDPEVPNRLTGEILYCGSIPQHGNCDFTHPHAMILVWFTGRQTVMTFNFLIFFHRHN